MAPVELVSLARLEHERDEGRCPITRILAPRFLDDGRIDLDNNAVERAIRPLALNRKNALFAGSDEGGDNWVVIATLIENCKLTGINPHTWLTATLTSLANGHLVLRIDKLLPHAHVA